MSDHNIIMPGAQVQVVPVLDMGHTPKTRTSFGFSSADTPQTGVPYPLGLIELQQPAHVVCRVVPVIPADTNNLDGLIATIRIRYGIQGVQIVEDVQMAHIGVVICRATDWLRAELIVTQDAATPGPLSVLCSMVPAMAPPVRTIVNANWSTVAATSVGPVTPLPKFAQQFVAAIASGTLANQTVDFLNAGGAAAAGSYNLNQLTTTGGAPRSFPIPEQAVSYQYNNGNASGTLFVGAVEVL